MKPRLSWLGLLTLVVLVSLIIFALRQPISDFVVIYFQDFTYLPTMVFAVSISALLYWSAFQVRLSNHRIDLARTNTEKLTAEAETLQEELGKDFHANLIRINFKYLDKYYSQIQVQADKSFLLCVVSASSGLTIILAGIVLMFADRVAPAYVVSAMGILSEFIAAIFFYLHSKTVASMAEYHKKLIITQNILLSLKLTEGLPEDARVGMQRQVVEALTKDVNQLLAAGHVQH